tara:strand:+ start:171 stop:659 length:489 start_codon:yes stop_codon:yes gene_type:complete
MNSKTIIKHVERLGLEAVTSVNGIPSFFLFVEIDTKDKAVLQSLIKYITNKKISVIVYESNKGYHIVSPSLLHFQKWLRVVKVCQQIYPNSFYYHDVIRISNKKNDSKEMFWYNADFGEVHKVSQDLLSLYESKFNRKIPCPNTVKTRLSFTKYEDLEIGTL